MPSIPPFSHLGDMPVETFIAEYWHKKPLLIRNAIGNAEWPLSADELAGLACEEGVESRLLVETPATGDWQLSHGPFEESRFSQLPAEHWTLLVQAVDHWLPEAADFVEQFRFIPSWRLDDLMISYAAKGGGVGPHYDNYDVFLIQAEGQRRWEIGGFYDEDAEFLPGKPVRILKQWQPQQTWILNPGDVLYLPPRIGHNGVAETDDCITYSVGYRAPQCGDMLMHFASFCAAQIKDEERYADPDLSLRLSSGEICHSDLERVQSLLRHWMEDGDAVNQWFGELVTEAKYDEQPAEPEYEVDSSQLVELLQQGGELRRSEGVRYAYSDCGSSLQLYVNGESFDCSADLRELLAMLSDHNQYSAQSLLPWQQHPEGLELLCTLVARGWLYFPVTD
ncbi:MAG: cupin domain-containing protein [Motiliproteus sp.]|nr:cupin domain-containing protein [Motiliproteus sp.]MCW9052864.1 cupin domain-containing protein [Motiliproteus sp.]